MFPSRMARAAVARGLGVLSVIVPVASGQRPVLVQAARPVVVRVSLGGGVAFPAGGSLRQLDPDLAGLMRVELPRLTIPVLDFQFEGRLEASIAGVAPSPRAAAAITSTTLTDLAAGIVIKDWSGTRGLRFYGFVLGGVRFIHRDAAPTRSKGSLQLGLGARFQPITGPVPFFEVALHDAADWGGDAARAVALRVGVSALQF